jgi:hypothetical protein
VETIAKHPQGIDRISLIKKVGVQSGGRVNKRLEELESSGFIQGFVPYGKKIKAQYYRVIDEYTLFYLTWIEPFKYGKSRDIAYWSNKINTGAWLNWSGRTFENICYKHVEQIRKALGLDQMDCNMGSWRYLPKEGTKEQGAQIDLLFDREDNTVSVCEIKYSENLFVIDKSYAANLVNKLNVFEKHFQKNKQIILHMITLSGTKKNMWSEDLIQSEVTLKDIMRW